MVKHHVLLAAGLLALAGCANARQTSSGFIPDARPATDFVPAAEAHDEVTGPLTLDLCIGLALANNPDIAGGTAQAAAARHQADISAAQRWPTLSAVGSYGHHLNAQRLAPASGPNQPGAYGRDLFGGDLVLAVPLYTGGRISSEIRASDLLRRAADHELVRTWHELRFNITSVFYAILGQQHVAESVAFSHKVLGEHRKRVEELIGAQKAAKVDLLRTEVRLASLQQNLVQENNRLDILKRVLVNLVGLDGSSLEAGIEGDLVQPDAQEPEVDMAATLDAAYASRPDLLAARAATQAQTEELKAVRAGLWPDLSLQASYGLKALGHPSSAPAGSDDYEDVGQVGLVLDIPLFEAGRTRSAVRRERAKLVAQQQKLRKLELQIRLDIETAVLNMNSSLERVQATQTAIDQAQESLRIEREKYTQGKGTITDVLDAQSALVDSQTSYYRALADHSTARAQLQLATGQ